MTDAPLVRQGAERRGASVRTSAYVRVRRLLWDPPSATEVRWKQARAHDELAWRDAPQAGSTRIARSWALVCDTAARTQGFLFIIGLMLTLSLILATLSQGQDLLTTIAEQPKLPFWTALALLVMSLQAWFWMRRIVDVEYGPSRNIPQAPGGVGQNTWGPARPFLVWAPRVAGGAPLLFVTLTVLAHAGAGMADPTASAVGQRASAYLWFIGANVVYWAFLISRTHWSDLSGRWKSWSWRAWPIFYLGVSLVLLLNFIFSPSHLAQRLGPAAVVFTAAGSILPLMTVLIQLGQILRLPVLALLLAVFVVSSRFNGCQHDIGRRSPWSLPPPFREAQSALPRCSASPYQDGRPELDDALQAWREAQGLGPPPKNSAGPKTPFVVVAAEGGASRAGYWTAVALENLQASTCGKFSKRLFAISSISGGSVGALGWIGSLPRSAPEAPAPCPALAPARGPRAEETPLDKFAGKDALSPTLAAMLFPDLIQRFLPFDALPDRARAIESAWEDAWSGRFSADHTRGAGPGLDRSFLDLWKVPKAPGRKPWLPISVIGGAWEEDGRRILTSPVRLAPAFPQREADDFYDVYGRDIRASTAIHNGARFPWVSPAGQLDDGLGGGRHMVDGGYFDSTGVDTALALLTYAAARDPRLQPILIVIRYRDFVSKPASAARVLNDALAPLRGGAASRNALQAAFNHPPAAYAVKTSAGYRIVEIGGPYDVELTGTACEGLPLNWVLSEKVKRYTRALGESAATVAEMNRAASAIVASGQFTTLGIRKIGTHDFDCKH